MSYECMDYDLVIVGAGPAGLSAAIKLKQLDKENNTNHSVCIVEKGSEVGAHILSGAILDIKALNELFPNWKDLNTPIKTAVKTEDFSILTKNKEVSIPNFLLPSVLNNHGNYIISLSNLCKWLAQKAEELGVEIFPGFVAKSIIYNEDNSVKGILTGEKGVDSEGNKTNLYEPPFGLIGKQTFFAEGCRGHLGKELISKYSLMKNNKFQTYGIGFKELWEIDSKKSNPGYVKHTIGWPLTSDTYGGSFLYHLNKNQVSIGFVLGLDYKNPYLNPYQEFQQFKTHSKIKGVLEGGKRISYGARALNEGGLQSLPKMSFPGGLLIGCEAGTLNVPKIKGTHTAMKTGILASEVFYDVIKEKSLKTITLSIFDEKFKKSWVYKELYEARNVRPGFKWGMFVGLIHAGIDQKIFRGRAPWTLHHLISDNKSIKHKDVYKPINYPKNDGILSFDKLTNVSFTGTNHKEDQPCHLKLKKADVAIDINFTKYDSPESRYCPAGVYEIIKDALNNKPKLQINFQNCIHCKSCDIKDPTQNIDWTPPEGGEGPNYTNM